MKSERAARRQARHEAPGYVPKAVRKMRARLEARQDRFVAEPHAGGLAHKPGSQNPRKGS
jgi:hypothetical protein